MKAHHILGAACFLSISVAAPLSWFPHSLIKLSGSSSSSRDVVPGNLPGIGVELPPSRVTISPEVRVLIPPNVLAFAGCDSHRACLFVCLFHHRQAVDLLVCHFITHHRHEVVDIINRAAFAPPTIAAINRAIGGSVSIDSLRFNVTGPLEPENFFRCSELRVARGGGGDGGVTADGGGGGSGRRGRRSSGGAEGIVCVQ